MFLFISCANSSLDGVVLLITAKTLASCCYSIFCPMFSDLRSGLYNPYSLFRPSFQSSFAIWSSFALVPMSSANLARMTKFGYLKPRTIKDHNGPSLHSLSCRKGSNTYRLGRHIFIQSKLWNTLPHLQEDILRVSLKPAATVSWPAAKNVTISARIASSDKLSPSPSYVKNRRKNLIEQFLELLDNFIRNISSRKEGKKIIKKTV